MKNPFKRRYRPDAMDVAKAVRGIVVDVMNDLRQRPIKVEHAVKRYVPRPTHITFVFRNQNGQEYRKWVDVSWKNSLLLEIPLYFLTERVEDNAVQAFVRLELEYDPKDRCG